MDDKKSLGEVLSAFLAGKGFYIVLLLCAALIGTMIWRVTSGSRADVEETTGTEYPAPAAAAEETPTELPSVPAMREEDARSRQVWLPAQPEPEPEIGSEAMGLPYAPTEPVSIEPLPAPEESLAAEAEEEEDDWFLWPVSGAMERPFAVETLAYDKTMGDWRTHPGVDLVAPAGSEVLAVKGGTVSAVYDDPLLGTVVEIDHGDGVEGVYANLDPAVQVAAGDRVSRGQAIAAVGATALSESAQGSHLHFAMRKGGEYVDPETLLPQR